MKSLPEPKRSSEAPATRAAGRWACPPGWSPRARGCAAPLASLGGGRPSAAPTSASQGWRVSAPHAQQLRTMARFVRLSRAPMRSLLLRLCVEARSRTAQLTPGTWIRLHVPQKLESSDFGNATPRCCPTSRTRD